MLKAIYIKSDFKQLTREPMMILLFLIPIIIGIAFRLMLTYLVPFIGQWFEFDIVIYHEYILSMSLVLTPGMLGIVMGFMLLDDKDGKIAELMSITPLGRSGYLSLRMLFVVTSTFFYTFYTYSIIGIYLISAPVLLYVNLLLCSFSIVIGLIFVSMATDKVKGLTYAKGLNIMLLFGISELLELPWLTGISGFFPTYWITRIIFEASLYNLFMGFLVHVIWLIIVFRLTVGRRQ